MLGKTIIIMGKSILHKTWKREQFREKWRDGERMRGFALLKMNEFTLCQFSVIGNLRYPLTAPKRQLLASWDLPRKPKNLRPCAVHFGVLHKVFFLLILSLQITQYPLLSSPSGHEQTQKRYPFFSGQTPIFPHHIIVSTQRNGQEIPVFFSSRFWREQIGSRIGLATICWKN